MWARITIGVIADAFSFVLDALFSWVPERQPWRNIVAGLYVLAAAAAVVLLVWFVASTW